MSTSHPSPLMSAPLVLVVENLQFSFGGKSVFSGLSARVRLRPGLTLLVGRNGTGKTTLLRLLIGLLGRQSGDIRLEPSPRYVQYVGQKSTILNQLSPAENARLFRDKSYWRSQFDEGVVEKAKGMFQAGEIVDGEGLSGGESRILELIRAMSVRPDVLLLDEPFGEWDVNRRDLAYRELAAWCEVEGVHCVLATHLSREIWPHARSVLYLVHTEDGNQMESYEPGDEPDMPDELLGLLRPVPTTER